MDKGHTLALARPPTRAFGVDPAPAVTVPLATETHIFAQTSGSFFAERRLDALLSGRCVKLAFIDGLHTFEQCLQDFIDLERYCDEASVIVLHDTVPLTEATQRRKQETDFWTGDVWKAVLALRQYRPELDIFTIATAPTGLTVVIGLDPSSRALADAFDEAVARFMDLPFTEQDPRLTEALGMVPNDWALVSERLRARGVL